MITRVATIIFFLAFGIGFFASATLFGTVAAIAAIVAGIAMIAGI